MVIVLEDMQVLEHLNCLQMPYSIHKGSTENKNSDISLISCMKDVTSCSGIDKVMYSASVALHSTNLCNLEAKIMGHSA